MDDAGNPLNEIADKETYHGLDSLRYILGYLNRLGPAYHFEVVTHPRR